ncbi:MAG: hypothetical protein LBF86_09630 [Helicobacteraceae bacterium]|jgi:hypothetical protein|nr:hypothetical protein [Helicobacteraceae bacterium]
MTLPNLFTETPQQIIDRMISRVRELDPSYIPYPADDPHLILEAATDEIGKIRNPSAPKSIKA